MTDFSKTPSVYYSLSGYNNSATTAVRADFNQQLQGALVSPASDYQLAVAKARVPLDTIPLTKKNIALKQYEVALREGALTARAYVRQLGGTQENFVWNCTPQGIIQKYQQSSGSLTPASTQDVSLHVPNVTGFLVTDYDQYIVVGSSAPGSARNLFYVIDTNGSVLFTQVFTQIQAVCIDRQQNVYVAHETSSQSVVEVYATTMTDSTFSMGLSQTVTQDAAGNLLTQIECICADDGYLVVGYQNNKLCVYNTTSYAAMAGWTDANITRLNGAAEMYSAEDRFVVASGLDVADDLFVGVQTGGPTQLLDMETAAAYLPGDDTFLPTAKIATISAGYGYGISSVDQHVYAWEIDGNSEPTTGVTAINGSDTTQYESMCTDATGIGIMLSGALSGNNQNLYALNIGNGTNNVASIIDREFSINDGAEQIISFDVQRDTWKMVCTSDSGKIYQSTNPVLPKRLIVDSTPSFSPAPASISRTQVGVSHNALSTTVAQTLSLGASNTPQPGSGVLLRDVAAAENALQIAYLQVGFSPSGNEQRLAVYNKTNLVTPVATYPLTFDSGDELAQGFTLVGTTYACVSTVDATTNQPYLYVYDASTFTEEQRIALPDLAGSASSLPIAGCDFGGASKFVFIANVDKLYSVQLPTSSTHVLTDVPLTPAFASAPTIIASLDAHVGVGGALTLCIAYSTSLLANAPDSLAILSFNGTYTALTAATVVATGLALRHGLYNNLCVNLPCQELWAPMLDGSIRIYSLVDTQFRSTVAATATGITSHTACIFVPQFGAENFYSWNNLTVTGDILGKAQCIAVSLENMQQIFCTHSEFKTTYKGALTPTGIAFTQFMPVQPGFESLSILHRPQMSTDTMLIEYSISNQEIISQPGLQNSVVPSISVNRVLGQFGVAVQNASINLYTPSAFASAGSLSLGSANLIFLKAGEDLSAGSRDIFFVQDFLDQVNAAFTTAWQRLTAAGGTMQSAPVITLGTDGLCTISYSNDYPVRNNKIMLNGPLSRLLVWQNAPSSTVSGFYELVLPSGSTSLKQSSKSLWKFNELRRILFQSNTLFVAGSWVGSNEGSRIVYDADVPLSEQNSIDNVAQSLYVQPNFLRTYQMQSNAPVTLIQLDLLYEYADQSVHTLMLEPLASFDVKLQFVSRLG